MTRSALGRVTIATVAVIATASTVFLTVFTSSALAGVPVMTGGGGGGFSPGGGGGDGGRGGASGGWGGFNSGGGAGATGIRPIPGSIGDGDDNDDNEEDCEESGSNPSTADPVQLHTLAKIERATDLRFPWVGGAFTIQREYNSALAAEAGTGAKFPMAGSGWFTRFMPLLRSTGKGTSQLEPSIPDLLLYSGLSQFRAFRVTNNAPWEWRPVEGGTLIIRANSQPYDFNDGSGLLQNVPLFTITEPGQWEKHFFAESRTTPAQAIFGPSVVDNGPINDIFIHDNKLFGLLAYEEDAYGNRITYEYAVLNPTPDDWDLGQNRVLAIVLQGADQAGSAEISGRIEFEWYHDSSDGAIGNLKRIRALRPDPAGSMVEVVRIEYDYGDQTVDPNGDTVAIHPSTARSTSSELVQVRRYIRVDGGPDHPDLVDTPGATPYPAREFVTQYRYHAMPEDAQSGEFPTQTELQNVDAESAAIRGDTLQPHANSQFHPTNLKMVILPQQIEAFAEAFNAAYPDSAFDSATEAGRFLLGLDTLARPNDNDTLPRPLDLASKYVAYAGADEEPLRHTAVILQYSRSECGCDCGGGSGDMNVWIKREYQSIQVRNGNQLTFAGPVERRTWVANSIITSQKTGTAFGGRPLYTPYRSTIYHTAQLGPEYDPGDIFPDFGIPYLIHKVVRDEQTGAVWVRRFDYHDTPGQETLLARKLSPSSIVSFSDADPNATPPAQPSSIASTDSGLVRGFNYDTQNRLVKISAREGIGSGLLSEIGDSSAGWEIMASGQFSEEDAKYLGPSAASKDGESATGANAEERSSRYGVYSFNGPIAWRKDIIERESIAENGPDTNSTLNEGSDYATIQLFDTSGFNVWTIHPDCSLTKREYDRGEGGTGSLIRETRNADPADLNVTQFPGLSTAHNCASLGRHDDGGSLTTEFKVDRLGRVVATVLPSGATTYIWRSMSLDNLMLEGAPTIPRYTETILPPTISQDPEYGFAGPATILTFHAGGDSFQTLEKPVISLVEDDLSKTGADRFALTSEPFALGADILVAQATTIEITGREAAETVWHNVAGDEYYTTEFFHDALGRIKKTVAPNGTITRSTYDIFDRIIKVEVGTDDDPSTGNMTTVVESFYDHEFDAGGEPQQGVGDGNLTLIREWVDDSTDRLTEFIYDNRSRPIATINPEPPHEVVVYDNLGRVVERGLFTSDPILQNPADPMDASSRGFYEQLFYSQRGFPYKRRIAIDPDPGNPDPDFLEEHSWFDSMGRPIQRWGPNVSAQKLSYDGLGRRKAVFITDRGGDPIPNGTNDTFSHAQALDGDTVFQQEGLEYFSENEPGAGEIKLNTSRIRAHDAAYVGDLADTAAPVPASITTYSATVYDDADRPIRVADFGANTNDNAFEVDGPAPPWPPATLADLDPGPGQAPEYANAIVSTMSYNPRGLIDTTTDPSASITKFAYDDLGRQVAAIENYDAEDASPAEIVRQSGTETPWGWALSDADAGTQSSDEDRTTLFGYDAVGNQTHQAAAYFNADAQPPTINYQVTEYVFGVSPNDSPLPSNIASNDLIRQITFPDSDTATDVVFRAYNRLGEEIAIQDQNEVIHTFTRDLQGRVVSDQVTFPVGNFVVDEAVDEIAASYDGLGRRAAVRSMKLGGVLNEIHFAHTSLSQIRAITQNPNGAATDANGDALPVAGFIAASEMEYDTVEFDPDSSDPTKNVSRLLRLLYPSDPPTGGRTAIDFAFGVPDSPDDRVSRTTGYSWSGVGGVQAVQHEYLGLARAVTTLYDLPAVRLDYSEHRDGDVASTSGVYPGLDRYGRVHRQLWVDDDWRDVDTSPDVDRPALMDSRYLFDDASNITARWDMRGMVTDGMGQLVGGSLRPYRDEQYSHDGLHRLILADRGQETAHDPENPAFASAGVRAQDWTLDTLGNWKETRTDIHGPSPLTESRTANEANEVATRDMPGVSSSPDPQYDARGNLRVLWRPDGAGGVVAWIFTYDAWNRLVTVEVQPSGQGAQVRATYQYNGLFHRTVRRADTDFDGALDEMNVYYYDDQWRLIEERIDDDNPTGSFTDFFTDRLIQRIWGLRYTDELVFYQIDGTTDDPSSTTEPPEQLPADGRFPQGSILGAYTLTDRNFNITAVLSTTGALLERVRYTAYGIARHSNRWDVDGDGDSDNDDLDIVTGPAWGADIGEPNYDPDADFDRDGTIGTSDMLSILAGFQPAAPEGVISVNDNSIGYAGYLYDEAVGLSLARFRWYDPNLGRWLQRDPLPYLSGTALYQYVDSSPLSSTDPLGLFSISQFMIEHLWEYEGCISLDLSLLQFDRRLQNVDASRVRRVARNRFIAKVTKRLLGNIVGTKLSLSIEFCVKRDDCGPDGRPETRGSLDLSMSASVRRGIFQAAGSAAAAFRVRNQAGLPRQFSGTGAIRAFFGIKVDLWILEATAGVQFGRNWISGPESGSHALALVGGGELNIYEQLKSKEAKREPWEINSSNDDPGSFTACLLGDCQIFE